MNREIKFRAWDTQLKKMVPRNAIPIFSDAYVTAGGYAENVVVSKLRQGTLMQYIGLKDKSGKEIYEGDIVKMHYFSETPGPSMGMTEADNEVVGTIEYRPDFAVFVVAIKDQDYPINDYCQEPSEELEVIGNIYENPELQT